MAAPRIDRESAELVLTEEGAYRAGEVIAQLRLLESHVQQISLVFHEDSAHYAKLQEALTYLNEVDESLYEAKKNRERRS
jgi:hypothetical protein